MQSKLICRWAIAHQVVFAIFPPHSVPEVQANRGLGFNLFKIAIVKLIVKFGIF
jgi:hypothetical protein